MHKKKWLIISSGILVAAAVGSGIYFVPSEVWSSGNEPVILPNGVVTVPVQGDTPPELLTSPPRQPIRPAAEVMKIQATGNIALQEQETVLSKVKALINVVHVKVGDDVAAAKVLVELDTKNLDREVEEARFDLAKAQSELKKLTAPAEPAKLTAAKQKLLIAQDELATVKAGPTAVELQSAETELFAAWAKYNELIAGKTEDELAAERTALRQAERNLKRAQEDYDSISWRADFEIAEERAKTLEQATDTYETAKAAYNKAVQPAAEKDVREAHSEALKAQEKLDKLRQKPTPKEIAEAELKVLEAQEELDKLTGGPEPDKLTEAKMEVQKKELLLAEAEATLANAKLAAPFAGTVVAVDAHAGKTAEVNDKMVTIANLQAFKLTVNVAEAKINRLRVGQDAVITLDALPGSTFSGKISYISPINQGENGVVSYAVTVELNLDQVEGIRPGMTAIVEFVDESLKDAWLIPTTAIQQDDKGATVTVYRNNEPVTVAVEPGLPQGEWTVVYSSDLQAGDEVEAVLSSFLDEDPFGALPAGEPVMVEE